MLKLYIQIMFLRLPWAHFPLCCGLKLVSLIVEFYLFFLSVIILAFSLFLNIFFIYWIFIFFIIKKNRAFLYITFVYGLQIKFHMVFHRPLLLEWAKRDPNLVFNLKSIKCLKYYIKIVGFIGYYMLQRNREALKCLDSVY